MPMSLSDLSSKVGDILLSGQEASVPAESAGAEGADKSGAGAGTGEGAAAEREYSFSGLKIDGIDRSADKFKESKVKELIGLGETSARRIERARALENELGPLLELKRENPELFAVVSNPEMRDTLSRLAKGELDPATVTPATIGMTEDEWNEFTPANQKFIARQLAENAELRRENAEIRQHYTTEQLTKGQQAWETEKAAFAKEYVDVSADDPQLWNRTLAKLEEAEGRGYSLSLEEAFHLTAGRNAVKYLRKPAVDNADGAAAKIAAQKATALKTGIGRGSSAATNKDGRTGLQRFTDAISEIKQR